MWRAIALFALLGLKGCGVNCLLKFWAHCFGFVCSLESLTVIGLLEGTLAVQPVRSLTVGQSLLELPRWSTLSRNSCHFLLWSCMAQSILRFNSVMFGSPGFNLCSLSLSFVNLKASVGKYESESFKQPCYDFSTYRFTLKYWAWWTQSPESLFCVLRKALPVSLPKVDEPTSGRAGYFDITVQCGDDG